MLAGIFIILAFSGCSVRVKDNQSTITVSGIGTVLVKPDMVQMNISYSHTARTTREAKSEVDRRIQQILDILKDSNIEDKDIRTVSLSYDVATEFREGRTIITGQRAQQTIIVSVNDIINNSDRFPALLDRITAIDRVVIRNITFDTENKTEFFIQSRELAFEKALEKANQYAELSGLKIAKVLTVSEERNRDAFLLTQSNVAYERAMPMTSLSIPTGEQEVTTEVRVTFLLK